MKPAKNRPRPVEFSLRFFTSVKRPVKDAESRRHEISKAIEIIGRRTAAQLRGYGHTLKTGRVCKAQHLTHAVFGHRQALRHIEQTEQASDADSGTMRCGRTTYAREPELLPWYLEQ